MRMRKINDSVLLEMFDRRIPQKDIAVHFGVSEAAVSKRLKKLRPRRVNFKKLKKHEQKFVTEIVDGKSRTEAAMLSLPVTTRGSAKSRGSELMKKPEIQRSIVEIMEEQGLTQDKCVRKLSEHVDSVDPDISLKAIKLKWQADGTLSPGAINIINATNRKTSWVELIRASAQMAIEKKETLENENAIDAEFEEVKEDTTMVQASD